MNKGIQFALITALISGFSVFASKIFVAKMDPIVYTTLKNGLVVYLLSLLVFGTTQRNYLRALSKKDWLKLLLIGIIGGSIPFALFFTGIKLSSAPIAALIHKTLFIWVALLAIPLLKEKINVVQILSFMIIMTGAIMLSGLSTLGFGFAEKIILAATLLWSIENIIAKISLRTIPYTIVAWARMTLGLPILIGIVVWQGHGQELIHLSSSQLQAVLVGGSLLTAYVLTWYKALSLAKVTQVAVVLTGSTIITSLLSAIFITHSFVSKSESLSAGLIFAGIALFLYVQTKKIKQPAAQPKLST